MTSNGNEILCISTTGLERGENKNRFEQDDVMTNGGTVACEHRERHGRLGRSRLLRNTCSWTRIGL
jgi:hypothetical protein